MLRVQTLALVASLVPSIARADSDGYYCMGKDYLAYQFGMAGPPVAPHNLFVIRLDPTTALLTPVVVQLPQFQVHGLRCRDDAIEVASFDSIYTVYLSLQHEPIAVAAKALREVGQIPREFESHNLARLARAVSTLTPERVSLKTQGATAFFLEMVPGKPNGACAVRLLTRLIRMDPDGRHISFLIWSGEGHRECGDS